MSIQLLINIFIAFLWTMLTAKWSSITFLIGYLIGVVILFSMRRFFPKPFYLKKVWAIIKFVYVVIKEILLSSVYIIRQVISPQPTFLPGIFSLKTKLKGNIELTIISLLITLTPGSVVMEISPEDSVLYIHAMDLSDAKKMILKSIYSFEKAIMEVTRDV
ncbi:MAG: Na+/H+ antiporter subunit E [Clostridia bacterium]|nr:Na+/H+ antiporter subunit E [Clostridia bacterium]